MTYTIRLIAATLVCSTLSSAHCSNIQNPTQTMGYADNQVVCPEEISYILKMYNELTNKEGGLDELTQETRDLLEEFTQLCEEFEQQKAENTQLREEHERLKAENEQLKAEGSD